VGLEQNRPLQNAEVFLIPGRKENGMKIKTIMMAAAFVGALYSLPDEPVHAGRGAGVLNGQGYGLEKPHCRAFQYLADTGLSGVVFAWAYNKSRIFLMSLSGVVGLPDCASETGAFDDKVLN